jgi:phosphatidylglycerophosphate synthase
VRVTQAVVLVLPGRFAGKKILGLTTLERALLAASESGVKEFILVGNDSVAGDEILASLAKDKRFRDRNIDPAYVPLSDFGNPSLREKMRERFWLMESLAVFSPDVLGRAAETDPGPGRDLLVIDSQGRGGHGEVFSGLALCSKPAFDRLREVLGKRGAAELDTEATAEVFPPSRTLLFRAGEDHCESVKSGDALRRADRYLIGTARKPTDGFFSKNFNRHISTFLTRWLLKLNVTPMEISVVVLAVGLMSGWLVGRAGFRNAFLGALLFEVASIIDGCDGENARLTFRGSKFGGTFDITGDAATFVFFFLNLPIGLWRTSGNGVWLVLGAISFLSMVAFYAQMAKYTRRTGIGNNIISIVKDIEKSSCRPGFAGRLDWLAARVAPIFRRDFFATGAFVIIACRAGWLMMLIIAVMAPTEAIYMHFYSRRRLRDACVEA